MPLVEGLIASWHCSVVQACFRHRARNLSHLIRNFLFLSVFINGTVANQLPLGLTMHISLRSLNLDQIGFLLGRAYYSYIGLLQRRLDEESLSQHLKPGMGSLLFALFRGDNRSLTALAAELQIAKSTMTGLVARMRKSGLLTVTSDPQDGRSSLLTLTPLARSLQPRCLRLADELEKLLGQKLTPAERRQFHRALSLVTQTITERLSGIENPTKRAGPGSQTSRPASRRQVRP